MRSLKYPLLFLLLAVIVLPAHAFEIKLFGSTIEELKDVKKKIDIVKGELPEEDEIELGGNLISGL